MQVSHRRHFFKGCSKYTDILLKVNALEGRAMFSVAAFIFLQAHRPGEKKEADPFEPASL
jgi:hypothetical protein